MGKNKQTIRTLSDLRELIKEAIQNENLLPPDSDSNPEGNSDSQSPESEKANDWPNHINKSPDADKCLTQIQDLLNWYFG